MAACSSCWPRMPDPSRAGPVKLAYLRPSDIAAAELVVVDPDGLILIHPLNLTQLADHVRQAAGLLARHIERTPP